ncbi:MAG: hypothetical protein IJE23_03780 [Tyzzerella sp.]|nr:hypothetical protein [Tyzzerella sp.]
MKNKIKQFSKGDFKVEQPDIRFSTTQIHMSVGEGEVYEGSFLIENTKDGDIRGLVYPSSFRVHCLEEGFEGNPIKVNFTYDSRGLTPGQMEQGKFTVVCNGGEYELHFDVVIEKPFIMTAYGKIQTLADFKKLAIQDFAEAKRLFRSRQFYEVLKYEDKRVRNLYENMRTWSLDEQALEEFLVGIKQKEKIYLTLGQEELVCENVLETQKSWIDIRKNTWGHGRILFETAGDFLEVKQNEVTTDDFVGNTYRLEYFVHADKLHKGYNYGKILVSTPYETLSIPVSVHQDTKHDEMRGMQGMIAGQGLKEYLAFISGKMSVSDWAGKAIKRVDQLLEFEPDSEYYQLLKAHIYLRSRREEEARWILDNGSYSKFVIGRKPEISAYYMFLTALLKKETLHTNRVLEEIYRVYMKHPYSWQLLCMIINLDNKYRDYNDRIRVLERQFFNGANQILLYAEAYICFQERVLLLRKLESFEIQILNFATKYKMLTRELALHMSDLVCQQKKYDPKLLRILERAYQMYEEPDILRAICMQLIKGNKTGSEYFKWYELAVKQEMKLAQLYEYYMMSMNPERVRCAFPRIVYLYFLRGINLDYRRTALLYENILTYESEDSEIYKQYFEQMKVFATEQLLKRHINESLRVIYNRFINPNTVALDELDALFDVCHAYQVTTQIKGMKYVLVIESDGSVKQRVAYKAQEGAKLYLYSKDARIVWEGDNGRHYTDSIPYETRRLFYEMRYLELCKKRKIMKVTHEQTEPAIALNFENLKCFGMDAFDMKEVFVLCSKRVREQEQVEDDFLLYLCFELMEEGYYDKAILTYLSQYYCGATSDMKKVWRMAKEYGVNAKNIAERIITQMLFSETMFQEEEIFEDYYSGRPYFRLKQAYLAYVSRMYVVYNRIMPGDIIRIMLQELSQKEYLADICKVAILKYYVGKEVEPVMLSLLKEFFMEMNRKRLVFPFFLNYPVKWLKEAQVYDKVMVEYQSSIGGKVKIVYRILPFKDAVVEEHSETILPNYDGVFVKEFVLYEGEILEYYFIEESKERQIISEKTSCVKEQIVYEDGKYGRLNLISHLSKEKQYEAMLHYRKEEQVAEELFVTY